jgi:hypothetical protein
MRQSKIRCPLPLASQCTEQALCLIPEYYCRRSTTRTTLQKQLLGNSGSCKSGLGWWRLWQQRIASLC